MASEYRRGVRLEHDEVERLLDDLDIVGVDRSFLESRAADRKRYRIERLDVQFDGPCGFSSLHAVPTRNISRDGIGFLTGNFIYPGSKCRVRLTGAGDVSDEVSGTVRWCRYVRGSRCIHEVGVEFDESIEVERYRPEWSIRALVLEENTSRRESYARILQPLSVKVTFMSEATDIHERIRAQQLDLILLDLDRTEMDVFEFGRGLRMNGYTRAVVGVTARYSPDVRRRALEAGFTDMLVRPLDRERVERLVDSLHLTVYAATVDRGASENNELMGFIGALSGQAADMERAFARGDVAGLRSLIERVRGGATESGFKNITGAATAVAEKLDDDASLSSVRERLNDLVRWCLAAKPMDDR